jgi:hypothetical protein
VILGRRRRPDAPRPLPVPPFAPDRPVPVPVAVPAPADPVAALAAAGVALPGSGAAVHPAPGLSVWTVPVAGAAALELWSRVRAAHPATGLWPVLAGPSTEETVAASLEETPDPPVASDGAAWLTARAADPDLAPAGVTRGPYVQRAVVGPAELLPALTGRLDRLWLVPAPAGWLVLGLLGWSGAVNHDVLGHEHATVLRRWAGAWQAELLALELDVLTLRVHTPPVTPEQALAAAVEAYVYCPDAVEQGTETLDALAEHLTQPAWQFWWD